jgi:hypothetical protein
LSILLRVSKYGFCKKIQKRMVDKQSLLILPNVLVVSYHIGLHTLYKQASKDLPSIPVVLTGVFTPELTVRLAWGLCTHPFLDISRHLIDSVTVKSVGDNGFTGRTWSFAPYVPFLVTDRFRTILEPDVWGLLLLLFFREIFRRFGAARSFRFNCRLWSLSPAWGIIGPSDPSCLWDWLISICTLLLDETAYSTSSLIFSSAVLLGLSKSTDTGDAAMVGVQHSFACFLLFARCSEIQRRHKKTTKHPHKLRTIIKMVLLATEAPWNVSTT